MSSSNVDGIVNFYTFQRFILILHRNNKRNLCWGGNGRICWRNLLNISMWNIFLVNYHICIWNSQMLYVIFVSIPIKHINIYVILLKSTNFRILSIPYKSDTNNPCWESKTVVVVQTEWYFKAHIVSWLICPSSLTFRFLFIRRYLAVGFILAKIRKP